MVGLDCFASLRTPCANDFVISGTRARIVCTRRSTVPRESQLSPVHERALVSAAGMSTKGAWKESHLAHQFFQRVSRLVPGILDRHASREFPGSYSGNGYHYEADEVMRCVRAGKLESTVMPLAESERVMEIVDEIRSRRTKTGTTAVAEDGT